VAEEQHADSSLVSEKKRRLISVRIGAHGSRGKSTSIVGSHRSCQGIISTSANDTGSRQVNGQMNVTETEFNSTVLFSAHTERSFNDVALSAPLLGKHWESFTESRESELRRCVYQEARAIISQESASLKFLI
jgi:hypothetical protein